ncbi:TPA: hypothetical protein N0F65_004066 [Lagenidium giganteum]|uniref:Secreted protein n=1 Tax=Lagenidium giganteum TaxID=4803 RepID=A0AAV2Z1H0_9STRA|nr:TPA: hypothetical protein N0F65_004066 [Lagenidium giganteum]
MMWSVQGVLCLVSTASSMEPRSQPVAFVDARTCRSNCTVATNARIASIFKGDDARRTVYALLGANPRQVARHNTVAPQWFA